jgi:hypothetical protein
MVRGVVGEGEGEEALFGDAVVIRFWGALKGTKMVTGSISTMSRRLPRLPVTQKLDPPSIMRFVELRLWQIVTDDCVSVRTLHTRGEQTAWMTLSVMYGSCDREARRESDS